MDVRKARSWIEDLWFFLTWTGKAKFVGVAVLMSASSFFEAAGIGLIFPLLQAVAEPQSMMEYALLGKVLTQMGLVGDKEIIIAVAVSFGVAMLMKNLFVVLQWYVTYTFLYGNFAELSAAVHRRYLDAPLSVHLKRNSADLIKNCTIDTKRIYTRVARAVLNIVAQLMLMISIMGVFLIANPRIGLVAVGGLAVLGLSLLWGFKRPFERAGSIRHSIEGKVIQAVNESLGPIREVKVLQREGSFSEIFQSYMSKFGRALKRQAFLNRMPRHIVEVSIVAMVVVALVVTVESRVDIARLIPTIGVFAAGMTRLLPSANKLVGAVNELRFEQNTVAGIRNEFGLEADLEGGSQGEAEKKVLSRSIEVREVAFKYEGATESALNGISFDIHHGEYVGVVGVSGAGKTTLVNLMLGLLRPTSGSIIVDDSWRVEEYPECWRRQVGYIPQEIYLADQSLAWNVAFGEPDDEIDRNKVWESLESAELAEFVGKLEKGLDTEVGERGVRLSGGQRQRIAIARAIYHRPRVLVLDEATSSLDSSTEQRVLEAIAKLAGERTVISISHDMSTLEDCEKIIVLRDGRMEAVGDYEELSESDEYFRSLVGSS